jgi:LysR family transcriptional regulator of gallate degradation
MEIKQLERFLAVIEHGSLSAAAKHLGLTQQALSTSISKFEKEIDLRLFDRAPGGVTKATPYGRALVRHARSQIAASDRAEQELHAIHDATTGTITVGIGEAFASEIMASAVKRLHSMRPEIRINLIEGYSEILLERLREGEFDFVAGGTGGPHPPDDLAHELLYFSNDVVVARPEHPLADRKNLQLKDLQDYTWLVPYSRTSDHNVIIEAFVAERLDPPKRIIGTDAYAVGMHLMLENDFLFMTAPGLIASQSGKGAGSLTVLDIDRPTVRRHAHLIYSADRPMSPAASVLLQEVRDACEELAP